MLEAQFGGAGEEIIREHFKAGEISQVVDEFPAIVEFPEEIVAQLGGKFVAGGDFLDLRGRWCGVGDPRVVFFMEVG